MIEIERKFLVNSEHYKTHIVSSHNIRQGYLSLDPERVVRVRISNQKGYLTIKGKSSQSGLSRFEWETEISVTHATALLSLCLPNLIEKTRHLVKFKQHTFEVDEFEGHNKGLLVAEIELKSEAEAFTQPEWLGKEVTGVKRYYNSNLCQNPFSNWS